MRALSVLCLLALIAGTFADDDNTKLPKLKLNDAQLSKFTSLFGGIKRMTASDKVKVYNKQLIPYKADAAHNVPQAVVTGLGYVHWNDNMYCNQPSCATPCPNPDPVFPTAWDYISNNPDLTIFASIVQLIGDSAVAQLDGPFTGTLLIPTDTALAGYLDQFEVQLNTNSSDAQGFYANFFSKLITYHALYERVYAGQWEARNYTTMYTNINGMHKITWVPCGGCSTCGGGCSSGGCSSGGCSSCGGGCSSGGCSSCGGGGPPSNMSSCVGAGCPTPTAGSGAGGYAVDAGAGVWYNGKYYEKITTNGRHLLAKASRSLSSATHYGKGKGYPIEGGKGKGYPIGGKGKGYHVGKGKGYPIGPPCNGCGGCGGGCGGSCGCNLGKLIDEQSNVVTFATADKFVYGGGVLHTVNEVLQPDDMFPSLAAGINSSSDFSYLQFTLEKIANDASTNFSLLSTLEVIGGSIAIPNNEAFTSAGVDPSKTSAADLLNTVAYHFCPFMQAADLLYTPYPKKDGVNPCLTILSKAYQVNYGLQWNFVPNWGAPDMSIEYSSGKYPNNIVSQTSKIVMADLTFPVQSGAVISQLLIPPTNLPQPNSTTRASRKSESLAARIRRAAMPAKVTLTEEAAKAWRLRDQREWAQSQRTAKIAAAGASADESRGKGPRVNMKAVFASYETKRQKHDTNLFEAFQRVRSTLRQ